MTVYRNGRVYSAAAPGASALATCGGEVTWLGAGEDAPRADVVVDLAGGWVGPAFVDAHVHATATGLALTGLDLSSVGSPARLLARVAAFAAGLPADATVLGHGWDESRWVAGEMPPSARDLAEATAGRRVYLSQASVHSALVSQPLLDAVPQVASAAGFDRSGWLRGAAHHAVRQVALGSVSPQQRAVAQRAMLERAASLGIGAAHECAGPVISSEADLSALLGLSGDGLPEVFGYWGELGGAAKARELGAVGAGGDLFVDGAFGSRTAWVSRAYDTGGCGNAYLDAGQIAEHVLDCAAHGMQAGFHAIGDAALAAVVDGLAAAAAKLGVEAVRAARHRVEHAELVDRALIAGFVEFGVVASVQPAFDRLWGGDGQMYAQRLGVERALASNPLQQLHTTGVTLAFGSDAPVTPLDPWGAVAAAVAHHVPGQRMSTRSAFAAHTRGGWRALGPVADGALRQVREREGALAPGAPATFAVWSTPAGTSEGLPVLVDGAGALTSAPVCERTVVRGRTIFQRDEGS
ncbi:amidohydrolase [Pilimelia columellifera subsp. columellifera]|uniref:Amidohydrolase n=1 Tax=Pilimelia columellifera subsp. columellifera TaxID=706583 RepID=A0ABN3NQE2_9ACTN